MTTVADQIPAGAPADPVAALLVTALQEHRIKPRAHECVCGWKAEVRQAADPPHVQYLRHGAEEQAKALRAAGLVLARCRKCGCTDTEACWPPCWWVEPDLCNACQ